MGIEKNLLRFITQFQPVYLMSAIAESVAAKPVSKGIKGANENNILCIQFIIGFTFFQFFREDSILFVKAVQQDVHLS